MVDAYRTVLAMQARFFDSEDSAQKIINKKRDGTGPSIRLRRTQNGTGHCPDNNPEPSAGDSFPTGQICPNPEKVQDHLPTTRFCL